MIEIESFETVLTGQWILKDGRVVADDVSRRILSLTKSHLVEVGRDASGWTTLYRDPSDGRYWELTYPQGELQGGGAPQLRYVTIQEAKQKYGEQVIKS
jgi:Immunity protein 27